MENFLDHMIFVFISLATIGTILTVIVAICEKLNLQDFVMKFFEDDEKENDNE